jgi:hypothetical protein
MIFWILFMLHLRHLVKHALPAASGRYGPSHHDAIHARAQDMEAECKHSPIMPGARNDGTRRQQPAIKIP